MPKNARKKQMRRQRAPGGSPWTKIVAIRGAEKPLVRRMSITGTLPANTSTVIKPQSLITTTNEWTGISDLFTEFRILGARVHYIPPSVDSQSGNTSFAILATDRSASLAAGALATIWALDKPKVYLTAVSSREPPVYEVRANDLQNQDFAPYGSPGTSTFPWIQCWNAGGASFYLLELAVEWRGAQ